MAMILTSASSELSSFDCLLNIETPLVTFIELLTAPVTSPSASVRMREITQLHGSRNIDSCASNLELFYLASALDVPSWQRK